MTEAPSPQASGRDIAFIEFLRSLTHEPAASSAEAPSSATGQERKNLAALAALRRGLGKEPGTVPEMYPYVVRFLPDTSWPRQEMPYYLVASLFAWHQQDWPEPGAPGLGGSLARLRLKQAEERHTPLEPGDSVERRFVALLNSSRDDLPDHLRQVIGLLRSADIPINWLTLLQDIQGWESASRRVQRRWAREFWGGDLARSAPGVDTEPAASAEARTS